MAPKGNGTPPPSPLRLRQLFEMNPPLPAPYDSSFYVDERTTSVRRHHGDARTLVMSSTMTAPTTSTMTALPSQTRLPLVLGRIVVPDLSVFSVNEISGDSEDDAGDHDNDNYHGQDQDQDRRQDLAGGASNNSDWDKDQCLSASNHTNDHMTAAAVVVDDDFHAGDESVPCPSAKSRRTAGLSHPASPPPGNILRRIREAERNDDGGAYEVYEVQGEDALDEDDDDDADDAVGVAAYGAEENDDDDDDGSLEDVCLDGTGMCMEMEPNGDRDRDTDGGDPRRRKCDESAPRRDRCRDPNLDGEGAEGNAVGLPPSTQEVHSSPRCRLSGQSNDDDGNHVDQGSTPPLSSPLAWLHSGGFRSLPPPRSSLKKAPRAGGVEDSSETVTCAARGGGCRHISFSSLEIRRYSLILGDHPCCSSGPPISLGWDYDRSSVENVEVETYESSRGERRSRREMRMGCVERREILLNGAPPAAAVGDKNVVVDKADGNDGVGATAAAATKMDIRRAERRVFREQHRTRASQARKASGFFFARPSTSLSSSSSSLPSSSERTYAAVVPTPQPLAHVTDNE